MARLENPAAICTCGYQPALTAVWRRVSGDAGCENFRPGEKLLDCDAKTQEKGSGRGKGMSEWAGKMWCEQAVLEEVRVET
jgi:hypothetical protein